MQIFFRFQKAQSAISTAEVTEIQKRVRAMREQIGQREIELADLFALVQEDERPVLSEIKDVKRPEIERFWPEQIPTLQPLMPESEPKVSYSTWQAPPRSTLPTTL